MLLGIKRKDGSVFYQERWTNQMPLMLSNPAFLRGEQSVIDEIEEEGHVDAKWPWPVALKKFRRSEYGAILVDFKNSILFSRQSYSAPGGIIWSRHSGDPIEIAVRLVELFKEGRMREVKSWAVAPPVVVPEKEASAFLKLLEECFVDTNEDERTDKVQVLLQHPLSEIMTDFSFSVDPLTLDHNALQSWKEIKKFRDQHGWP